MVKEDVFKEGDTMSAILEKKQSDLKEKLARIRAKAPVLNTKNGMIELNSSNPQHREWFKDDEYKGK